MDLFIDPEEQIICPYNPAHYIMRKRMNTHLFKCKKNYPESKLVECDFNVNHKIPEPELQYHHENCPDRRKVEHTVYQEEGAYIDRFPVQNIVVEAEESWDNLNTTSYDPSKYCEANHVVRHLDVAPPSSRKNFRMGERNRLNQLSNNTPGPSTTVQQPPTYRNPPGFRRTLPERPRTKVEEETPNSVKVIMERVQIGKNKTYISK